MPLFNWEDSYSVGLASVDYQHRRLVDMVNLLDESVSIGSDEETLRKILKELYAYTEYHFTTEEEMMRAAGPALGEHYRRHKGEHSEFTAKIRPLAGDGPLDVSALNEALFEYLVRWLVDHILGSDKEMGYLLAEASRWADDAGEMARTSRGGVVEDERREAVERSLLGALKESETRFRNLSDSVPVLIWVSDASGRPIFFNKPALAFSGHSPAELKEGRWQDVVHPDDLPLYLKKIADSIAAREGFTQELRLKRADGRYRWMLESTVVRQSEAGEFLGLIGSALDITERKNAERILIKARQRLEQEVARQTAELRATNRRLEVEKAEQQVLIKKLQETQDQLLQSEKMASIGQLAAGVAHEINNPVAYIASNLRSLETYTGDLLRILDLYRQAEQSLAEAQRVVIDSAKADIDLDFLREDLVQLVRESQEGTQRVKQIVQTLKDFSHVDEAEWQWTDLIHGLDSTLSLVNNEIKYKAEVVREYGEIPEVYCLPAQINQVFMNLFINAAQAIEEQGTITVRTGHEGDQAWIDIEDTGVGIPAANLRRVFEPFFTTKPVGKGTGLGLSLSYSIVDKHKGRFEVTSKPGQGTRFRIWLPVNGPADAAGEAAPETEAVSGAALN